MDRRSKHKLARPAPVAKSRPRTEPGTRMSVLLANPDYLLEGFAEKRCKYIGELGTIPTAADLNDRSFLLSSLDTSRNAGRLPWRLSLENEVSVTISAYNMKIIREDRTGTVLHRMPIHHIACCCYINDDDQHLLFIRAGDANQPHCPVHVLLVAKRADAEEVCTILQEAFQLVYTEATVQQLNESISAGEKGGGGTAMSSKRTQKPSKVSPRRGQQPTQREQEDRDEDDGGGDESDGEEGVSAEELVQKYMERLHKLLDFKELREFASLLKQYRDNLPVRDFLSKLKELYGAQRGFLIPDMCSFIPEEDRVDFEAFLVENNIAVNQSDLVSTDKPHPSSHEERPQGAGDGGAKGRGVGERRKGRGGGKRGHATHVADVDKFLADIDSHAETMMESTNF